MSTKQEGVISKAKEKLKREVLDIENRTDISNDEKATRIIKVFATTCAAVAVQPIPLQDIFVLTPLQAYMGTRIAAIRGVPISKVNAITIIKEIAGVVGFGMLGQNFVLTAYKIGVPFAGGFMTIPLVYAASYAIGKTMDFYFIKKSRNESFNPEELKKVWKETLKKKKAEGKENRKDIWKSRDDYEPKN